MLCEVVAVYCVVVCAYFFGNQQNWIFQIQIILDEMCYVRLDSDVNEYGLAG